MANKFSSPVGKLAWSNLVTPILNLKQEREWNCALVLPEAQIHGIMSTLEECLKVKREKDPSFPRENAGLNFPYGPSTKKDGQGNKTVEPGMVLFKFKRPYLVYRKATMTNEQNTPPVLFDSMGHPVLKLPAVNPGSEGRVIYDTYAYDKAGQKGVGLQLLGFQIFKLNVSTIEVGALVGGWVADDSQAASREAPTAEGPSDTDTNW